MTKPITIQFEPGLDEQVAEIAEAMDQSKA